MSGPFKKYMNLESGSKKKLKGENHSSFTRMYTVAKEKLSQVFSQSSQLLFLLSCLFELPHVFAFQKILSGGKLFFSQWNYSAAGS